MLELGLAALILVPLYFSAGALLRWSAGATLPLLRLFLTPLNGCKSAVAVGAAAYLVLWLRDGLA